MKKSILLLGILVMAIGAASAQEIEPIRIGIGMPASFPAVTLEYAFPIGSSSLGVEVGVIPLVVLYGAELTVRYYPLSNEGKGLLLSATYSAHTKAYDDWATVNQGITICAGYRFIVFKHLSLHAGLGYMGMYFEGEPTPLVHGLGMDFGLSVAF